MSTCDRFRHHAIYIAQVYCTPIDLIYYSLMNSVRRHCMQSPRKSISIAPTVQCRPIHPPSIVTALILYNVHPPRTKDSMTLPNSINFFQRLVWNKLSLETVNANSVCSFRARLIHEDLSRFLKICL